MRRRNLLGDTVKLTLSTNSYSATPAASTQYVYAYYGGNAITNLTTSMISNSNASLMTFSVNSSGCITVNIKSQSGNTTSRTGTLTLTYSGQQQTYTVTQAADYVTNTSSYDYESKSYHNMRTPTVSVSINGNIATNSQSFTVEWPISTYTYTTTYYASGYQTTNNTLKSKKYSGDTFNVGAISYDWTAWEHYSSSSPDWINSTVTVDVSKTTNRYVSRQSFDNVIMKPDNYTWVFIKPSSTPSTTTPPSSFATDWDGT